MSGWPFGAGLPRVASVWSEFAGPRPAFAGSAAKPLKARGLMRAKGNERLIPRFGHVANRRQGLSAEFFTRTA